MLRMPCVCRWLSTQYEDGGISRVLLAGSSRPPVTYRVQVTTSDLRGAGTDANVYLQLHGLLGDGVQHQLLGGATSFDRWAVPPSGLPPSNLVPVPLPCRCI
jgi:hypothetical protein